MKNWLYFLVVVFFYLTVHESTHALVSSIKSELNSFVIHWYGPEVIYNTPVNDRLPEFKWALIAGLSGIVTISIGYVLFFLKTYIYNLKNLDLKRVLYYATIVFLVIDPLYYSVLTTFIGGKGDIAGISVGLRIPIWTIQVFFGIIFLINRELAAAFIFKSGVKTNHFLFRSWFIH